MRQSLAFSRMSRNAACASATASSSTSPSAVSLGAGFALALTMTSPGAARAGWRHARQRAARRGRVLLQRAVLEHEAGDAALIEPLGDLDAFVVETEHAQRAARRNHCGRARRYSRVRQEHSQRRIADVRDHAIARRRGRDRFWNRPMLRARRSVRPEPNFRLRAHWRDGGECDAGAENEVAAAHPHCFFSAARAETRSKNSKIAGQTIGTMLPWLPSTSR